MVRAAASRWLAAVAAVFVVASCGGSTFDGSGSGGSSGKAGSGTGGSSGKAGSGVGGGGAAGGTGGSSSGGSSAGGSAGSGGQAGMPALCSLPAESGMCQAYMPSYFHDAKTGLCQPFVYGGCGGNDNRFATLAECQAKCHGGSPDMDACEGPLDCMLVATGCCAECDPVEGRAFVALGHAFLQDYETEKGCGDVLCGACPSADELAMTSQYFVAACEVGQCTVVDIRQTPITECTSGSECVLRDGAACCEGCDGTGLVSVNAGSDLSALVCGKDPSGCPPCVPIIPAEYMPSCEAGRCSIFRLE